MSVIFHAYFRVNIMRKLSASEDKALTPRQELARFSSGDCLKRPLGLRSMRQPWFVRISLE